MFRDLPDFKQTVQNVWNSIKKSMNKCAKSHQIKTKTQLFCFNSHTKTPPSSTLLPVFVWVPQKTGWRLCDTRWCTCAITQYTSFSRSWASSAVTVGQNKRSLMAEMQLKSSFSKIKCSWSPLAFVNRADRVINAYLKLATVVSGSCLGHSHTPLFSDSFSLLALCLCFTFWCGGFVALFPLFLLNQVDFSFRET